MMAIVSELSMSQVGAEKYIESQLVRSDEFLNVDVIIILHLILKPGGDNEAAAEHIRQ